MPGYLHNFDWKVSRNDPKDELFADLITNTSINKLDSNSLVIQGLPFDGAIKGRPGAHAGPLAIREKFSKLKSFSLSAGNVDIDLFDLGDLALDGMTVFEAHDVVEKAQRQLFEKNCIPVSLGGDHSLTYPLCSPLIDLGPTAAISFDAHLDTREVIGEPCSGSSFSRLNEKGLEKLVVIGVRDFANSRYFINKAYENSNRLMIVPASDFTLKSVDAILRDVLGFCDGLENLYLSIDIDVADQSKAPGVSAPTTSGLSIREIMVSTRMLATERKIKAIDLMEVSPPLDNSGMTARAAATILASVISGISSRA